MGVVGQVGVGFPSCLYSLFIIRYENRLKCDFWNRRNEERLKVINEFIYKTKYFKDDAKLSSF